MTISDIWDMLCVMLNVRLCIMWARGMRLYGAM